MADPALEERMAQLDVEVSEIQKMLQDFPAWRQEMHALVSETWELHRQNARQLRETERLIRKNSEENRLRHQETEGLFKEMVEEGRLRHQETERLFKEVSEERRLRGLEVDRRLQESSAENRLSREETDRSFRALHKELGALGEKFGGFAEGMALPSMERCLAERFDTTHFTARVKARIGGEEIYLDALASSRGEGGTACVVEVKSRLREEGIEQLLRALAAFPRFFPEHAGKRLIGVLAAVEALPELEARVLREGLVLALISDDVFELAVPEDFEPRAFPNSASAPAS